MFHDRSPQTYLRIPGEEEPRAFPITLQRSSSIKSDKDPNTLGFGALELDPKASHESREWGMLIG